MAARKVLTNTFIHLTVGKRLGLGFLLMLLLVVTLAGTGIRYLNIIESRTNHVDFSYLLNNQIDQAKYNRAMYGQTYAPQYLEGNRKYIDDAANLIEQNQDLSWQPQSLAILTRIGALIGEYRQQQNAFTKAIEEKNAVRQSWNMSEVQESLSLLERQLTDSDLQLAFIQLNQKLTLVRYNARGLLLSLDREAEAPLITSINDARSAASALSQRIPEAQNSFLQPLLTALDDYKDRISAYMPAYENEQQYAKQIDVRTDELGDLVSTLLKDELAQTHADISSAQLQMGVTTLIAVIAGLLISWRITLQITRPLHSTLEIAQRIATGDLRQVQTNHRRDEMGQLLNAIAAMGQNLREMIEKIQMGVSQVSTAASEISAGNTDLSSRTEQQAAAVEETAASMEQLTATVKQNADNAHHANQLATEASQTAQQGGN
jgi:methyl-accepting chemotaxis protein-2 (aspartate sensor receptor)